MIDKRVGIASTRGKVYPMGIAQVCVPPVVDRDQFVKSCLTTGLISIQPQVGGAIHRVPCDKTTLQTIDFPSTSKEFGSYIVYVNDPKTKLPYVIATFLSIQEYSDLNENQFKLSKSTEFGTVSIIGDGKGRIAINVQSEKGKQGRFDINLSNPDNTAQFNVNTKGVTNVYSSGKVSVQSNDEIALEATDGTDTSSLSITKIGLIMIVAKSLWF